MKNQSFRTVLPELRSSELGPRPAGQSLVPAGVAGAGEPPRSGLRVDFPGGPPFEPEGAPPQHRMHHDPRLSTALDPLARSLAGGRAWVAPVPGPAPLAPNVALVNMEQVVARLVRRVAWGGEGGRGTARIELGAGELAGATITVHAEARELSVDIELPPGVVPGPWRDRLLARLERRGFSIRELNVG